MMAAGKRGEYFLLISRDMIDDAIIFTQRLPYTMKYLSGSIRFQITELI